MRNVFNYQFKCQMLFSGTTPLDLFRSERLMCWEKKLEKPRAIIYRKFLHKRTSFYNASFIEFKSDIRVCGDKERIHWNFLFSPLKFSFFIICVSNFNFYNIFVKELAEKTLQLLLIMICVNSDLTLREVRYKQIITINRPFFSCNL